MSVLLVVAAAAVGTVAGWAADPLIVRVPRKVAVRGPVPDLPVTPALHRVVVGLVCGALAGGLAAKYDGSWVVPAYVVLSVALVVLTVIDLQHYLLPNRIVYPLAGLAVALFALAAVGDGDGDALVRALLGGLAAYGAFFVLHLGSPRSMGFGDVKLSFTLGLALGWLGWGELLVGLFLGFLYGAVIGVLLIVTGLRSRKDAVPFGPFLAAGTLTALFVGTAIVDWYRG